MTVGRVILLRLANWDLLMTNYGHILGQNVNFFGIELQLFWVFKSWKDRPSFALLKTHNLGLP